MRGPRIDIIFIDRLLAVIAAYFAVPLRARRTRRVAGYFRLLASKSRRAE